MPDAMTNINQAISAYKSAAGNSNGNEGKESNAGDEFASLVKNAIDEAIKIGKKGERATISGINDHADLNKVVTAVAEAELTLQTVVAVRDKVLDAYREILRMPM